MQRYVDSHYLEMPQYLELSQWAIQINDFQ